MGGASLGIEHRMKNLFRASVLLSCWQVPGFSLEAPTMGWWNSLGKWWEITPSAGIRRRISWPLALLLGAWSPTGTPSSGIVMWRYRQDMRRSEGSQGTVTLAWGSGIPSTHRKLALQDSFGTSGIKNKDDIIKGVLWRSYWWMCFVHENLFPASPVRVRSLVFYSLVLSLMTIYLIASFHDPVTVCSSRAKTPFYSFSNP